MTSYSVFPRQEQPQEQPLDQLAASRAHSRFVEGSMNDRVSNAPPVDFLGPDEVAAYERQFFLDNSSTTTDSTVRQRPISTSGSSAQSSSSKKSFFAPLWDGVRERFHMARTKSASSIKTKSSFAGGPEQYEQPRQGSLAENISTPGYYPSREEVMENYKSLVEAGFFSSHAIQGTRHNPPPAFATQQRMEAPLPSPPTQNLAGLPFSQRMHLQTKPAGPRPFASVPYSATQPSPTGDAPLTRYAMPDPRPIHGIPRKLQKENILMPPPPLPTSSPQRGTKRGMADMAGGPAERWETTNNEGGSARRLVKKLRKSASRVSADLTRPATSNGTGNGGISKSSVFGGSSVSLVGGPSAPAVSGRAMGLVRSLSNSFKRDGAGKITNATTPPTPAAIATEGAASITTTGNKLSKARKALSRRASLSRGSSPRSNSISLSHPPVSYNPNRQPLPFMPHTDPTPTIPASPAKSTMSDDAMILDSPPPRQSVEVPMAGLSVPSFHYPQRKKLPPLSVVPDANRGIPVVPDIPLQFAGKYGKTDGFSFGLGGGMVRERVEEIEKENSEVF